MNYLQLIPAFDDTCFAHLDNGKKKNISDIKPGDIVKSSENIYDIAVIRKVIRIIITPEENTQFPTVPLVSFNSGLRCTYRQKILYE